MSKRKPTLTLPPVEYLRECFRRRTGNLIWKVRPREHFPGAAEWVSSNNRFAGKVAGTRDIYDNYYRIKINSQRYLMHRVIYKLVTGDEPPPELDHKDTNRVNNAPKNLRPATPQEQQWNAPRRISISGYRGVYPSKRMWKAQLKIDGIIRYLGHFQTPEEASIVVEAVAKKLHGPFYRAKNPRDSRRRSDSN